MPIELKPITKINDSRGSLSWWCIIVIVMFTVDTNNKYRIKMIDSCESVDSYMLYFLYDVQFLFWLLMLIQIAVTRINSHILWSLTKCKMIDSYHYHNDYDYYNYIYIYIYIYNWRVWVCTCIYIRLLIVIIHV